MLALNQNRNSSWGLESRVQTLSDNWQRVSQDLENLKLSSTQEIEGLREWSRKLEKKSKRMEGRLASLERNLRENRRHAQKQTPDPGPDFSNLTQELQSQDERLAALMDQRDELLIGLNGLQESLKHQAQRVTRLEGRLGEALQQNGGGEARRLRSSYVPAPQSQTGRILDAKPLSEGTSYSQTDDQSKSTAENRKHPEPHRYQATPNQPKQSKPKKSRPQPESHQQIQDQDSDLQPRSTDHLRQPDSYHPRSQIQQTQRKYQTRRQSHPRLNRHPQSHNSGRPSWHHPPPPSAPSPEPTTKDRPSETSQGFPRALVPDDLPQSESDQDRESSWDGGEEEESDSKVESSVIHNFLHLPVRHKIPTRPIPKRDATICNVDSMLFFPSASAENYVTFFRSLPDLPELSVCLWLRVEEASHVGTLLSYATDVDDNQLVLYGRNSSASSSSSRPSYASSPSPSLDFVIGDPVYRRLSASALLDARWHHLCAAWSSIQGRFWHYIDRRLASSGSNFRKGWEIPGGGSVVLGQEQDSVGGGFDPAEGFVGQVAGFRVWNRVLSPAEVDGVAEGRGVPRGVVLGMEDIMEVHGEVQQVACECLEHCV
ncbi:Pentraxin-4 [Liparis tanakae]|uniref:Pentraxin-4 n=1 Tax=Liparis tanakae TaxID=230148 RepID=A0A4Z2F7K7_9TELE|nr:Pentraxin-4 [Liparis tanakae]